MIGPGNVFATRLNEICVIMRWVEVVDGPMCGVDCRDVDVDGGFAGCDGPESANTGGHRGVSAGGRDF